MRRCVRCAGWATALVMIVGTCEIQRPVAPGVPDAVLLVGSTQAPPPARTPDSPSSYPLLSQDPLASLSAPGWNVTGESAGLLSIATVLGSLIGTPGVLQFTYPVGFVGAKAPATVFYDFPSDITHFYGAISWMGNANWQGNSSNVNKLEFIQVDSSGGGAFLSVYGSPGGPYELRMALELRNADSRDLLAANIASVPIVMGQWHLVEWQIEYNTTTNPANGIVEWWLDGKLVGKYTDVLFPRIALEEYQISPTWGGAPDVKKQTDYFWFANAVLRGY